MIAAPLRPFALYLCLAVLGTACASSEAPAPPVATPSLTLSHDRAAAGSPLELTYKFDVSPDARISRDYRVLAHIVDTDEELMWTDDHEPPVPTSQWKPGQTVEYTRTVFVPVFPYIGEAAVNVGLYSIEDQTRLPLIGEDVGQRAYRVARLQLLPQTDNLFTVFKDGWHPAEVAGGDTTIEWQWTTGEATLAFKNPKKDVVFYLDVDSPGRDLHPAQQVEVSLGDTVVDRFTVEPDGQRLLRRIPMKAAHMGAADMSEVQLRVDKTFVPATIASGSKDTRELGVRVFHAFVDPR